MRRIYRIDLGLLIAAGTIAFVLMAKPGLSAGADSGSVWERANLSKVGEFVREAFRPAEQPGAYEEEVSEPDR